MNHLAFGLQLRPNKDSHFEVTGHLFSLKETTDGWYHAGQSALGFAECKNIGFPSLIYR